MKISLLHRIAVGVALAACALPYSAAAQQFPQRALRLVVPFAPGGSTDTLARIVGQRLTESLGQPVVVITARRRAVSSAPISWRNHKRTATPRSLARFPLWR